jgi:hypothetical protein
VFERFKRLVEMRRVVVEVSTVMGGVASENENDHDGARLEDRRLRKRLRVQRFNVEAQNEGVRVRRSSIEA